MKKEEKDNRIIVAFHVGRGGRFNNPGHVTYIGEKSLHDFLDDNRLFYCDRDRNGRYCKPYYTDCNGNTMLTAEDIECNYGTIGWDCGYDTTVCRPIEACEFYDIFLIILSDEVLSNALDKWLTEWLIDGLAHDDSEIVSFVHDHRDKLIERGYFKSLNMEDEQ